MIRILAKVEPAGFDANVRQRGAKFLVTNPKPSSKEFRPHQYWKWAATELYEAYSRICAYSCMYLPVPSGTIDHFEPKSSRADLAYEWTNYRLAHHRLNSNKGECQVLDPLVIQTGWFVLDFPSCLVHPGEGLPKATEDEVIETIKVLRLNDDDALVQERCEVMVAWARGDVKLAFVRLRWPFLAVEVERQAIEAKLPDVFKTR